MSSPKPATGLSAITAECPALLSGDLDPSRPRIGSTTLISEIGDDAWGKLRVRRNRLVRDCVEDNGGRVIDLAGDGSMSMLPGPAAAIRCAERLHDVVRPESRVDLRSR